METTVARVEVDTQPDGSLLVRWQLEGQPAPVDIATGPTPDHLDHRHHKTVPAGTTEILLNDVAPGRLFVSVAAHDGGPAVVAADRRIPFSGITNFRDLGGYRNVFGATVRWGRVFRADALHGLSSSDLELYEGLGMRAVFDLREESERDERPNPFPSHHVKISGRPPEATGLPAVATVEEGERLLYDFYAGVIEHSADQIGRLFTALSTPDGLPAVFHCHAGKDRTGMVAALLLETLRVERQTVLDDYELTARYRLRSQQEPTFNKLIEIGLAPEAAAGVLTTPRWAMQKALEEMDGRFGGVENFLTGPAGMRAADIGALRGALLEG